MERVFHIFLAGTLLALTFTACGQSYDEQLRELDDSISRAYTEEDLAHFSDALDGLAAHADDMREADRMHLALLRADLQNKQFVPFTDDSLMRAAVDYYDRHGTPNERMHAYYLLSAVYRDLSSPLQSQRALHQAAAVADTADKSCDFRLLAKIYGQLGELYLYRTDYQVALDMLQRGELYGRLANDSLLWTSIAYSQVNCYRDMGLLDSVLSVCERSYRDLTAVHDVERASNTWLQKANAYVRMRKFQEASHCLGRYEKESGLVDGGHNVSQGMSRESYYNIKGTYYLECGQIDSALTFFYKELQVDEEKYIWDACYNLYLTYRTIGNTDSSYKYLVTYEHYRIRWDSISATSQLQELQTHFDINRERQNTDKYKGLWIFWLKLFALLGMAFALCLTLWVWYRRRMRRMQQKLWEDYRRLEEDSYNRLNTLEELRGSDEAKQQTIDWLNREMEQLRKAKEYYRTSRLTSLDLDNDVLSVTENLHDMATADKRLPDDHPLWQELERYVSKMSPRLAALMDAAQLSPKERRVTQLVWAWFTPGEIRILLSASKQNISTTRVRLHKKVFDADGTAQEYDERIHKIDLETVKKKE